MSAVRPDPADIPGRVIESFGRRVIAQTASDERLSAELFGKRLSVVCGDDVQVRPAAAGSNDEARIVAVGPRRSLLARTDSRGRSESLAANLSLLAIVIAPQPLSDPYIVDRYLAGASYTGIDVAIIANKCDLGVTDEFNTLIEEYTHARYQVLRLSALQNDGVAALHSLLRQHVTMLVGQSGVGKSTLTNRLIPATQRPTRTLSGATGEGRHTTVSTALFRLPGGGELIDSPGVRDYAPALIDDAMVQVGWREIMALAPSCRFNNCLHLREPGCAVSAAVASGDMSTRRYESYKRLMSIMRGLAPDYERRR